MRATVTIGEQAKPQTLADLPNGVVARVRFGILSVIRWRYGGAVLYRADNGVIGVMLDMEPSEYTVDEVIGLFTMDICRIDGVWQVSTSITPKPQPKKQTLAELDDGVLATCDGDIRRYKVGDVVYGLSDETSGYPIVVGSNPETYPVDKVHGKFVVEFHE